MLRPYIASFWDVDAQSHAGAWTVENTTGACAFYSAFVSQESAVGTADQCGCQRCISRLACTWSSTASNMLWSCACVCVCPCMRVRVSVHACARACVCECARVSVSVSVSVCV